MASRGQNTLGLKDKIELAASVVMTHPSDDGVIGPTGEPIVSYLEPQSSRDIKKSAKAARVMCGGCQKLELKASSFKACGGCHSSLYCSRECQKKDWSTHKDYCIRSGQQKRMRKLLNTLMSNVNLKSYLKVAIALHLGLDFSTIKPFSIMVSLMIEPENIVDFARLRGELGPKKGKSEKLKGMLQIAGILPNADHYYLSDEQISTMCRALMKAEEETPDPTGLEGIPGVVLFSLTDSTPEAAAVSQIPIIIQPDFLEIARAAEPFTQFFPSRRGIYLEKPMSVDSCIEHMNTVIRRDKNNRLLLRTEMTPTDEEIIRQSVTLNLKDTLTDTLINTLMKKKLLREYIYSVLMGTTELPFD